MLTANRLNVPSGTDIMFANVYIIMSSIVAFATCVWAAHTYFTSSNNEQSFTKSAALLGAIPAGLLLVAFLFELAFHRCPSRTTETENIHATRVTNMVNRIAKRRQWLMWAIHVGTSLTAIFSICVAAVNIYTNETQGLYALSCITIVFYTAYLACYTPDNTMSIALYHSLSEADQNLAKLQRSATSYVLRPPVLNQNDYM